jgi:hypothetical protein
MGPYNNILPFNAYRKRKGWLAGCIYLSVTLVASYSSNILASFPSFLFSPDHYLPTFLSLGFENCAFIHTRFMYMCINISTSRPKPVMRCTFIHVLDSSHPMRSINQSLIPVIACIANKMAMVAFIADRDCIYYHILSNFALMATMTVLALIRIAPIAGLRSIP